MASATWSASVCRTDTSSSVNAAGSTDWTSSTPMTRSPTFSGSAISERVSGRSGLSKKTASAPTSSAMRGFPVPAT
jgi:hypothetical protein